MSLMRSILILGLVASAASGAEQTSPPGTKSTVEAATEPRASGLRVFIHPTNKQVTGEPSSVQIDRYRKIQPKEYRKRPADELRRFFLAGGGQGIFLDGWADHSLSVRRTQRGEVESICRQHRARSSAEIPDRNLPSPLLVETPELK